MSPWEESLTMKHFEKMDKYNKPVIDLQEGKNHEVKWTVVPLCVEVRARGAINEQPWKWMCKRPGFSKCSKRRLTQGVHDAAVACSYYTFLCRFLRTFEPQVPVDTSRLGGYSARSPPSPNPPISSPCTVRMTYWFLVETEMVLPVMLTNHSYQ